MKKRKSEYVKISVNVSLELIQRLEMFCKDTGYTKSSVIVEALYEYLESNN